MNNANSPFNSSILKNPILLTDSYKASHFRQYPPNTQALYSYIEARGGIYPETLFFGLQMILQEYLSKPITRADIDEAESFWRDHGEPFDRSAFEYIVDTYNGFWPVTICAVPEGGILPTGLPLVTVECADPACFWVASYLETLLLQVWYPTTVATYSKACKAVIANAMQKSSDEPDALDFKLHDFGFRGASSPETAARGACAHLVNFKGTDTTVGILAARVHYDEPMAGFSIPAAEHSTITSWGRDGEADAYRNMIQQFSRPGSVFAVVSDSYDLMNAVNNLWGGELKQQVIENGGLLVVRPDSGELVDIVCETVSKLADCFGYEVNSKGFKVLKNVRVIQGDGVNRQAISDILDALLNLGFSADNVNFGMGGGLLQDLNRDTCKFAMKCSAVLINGQWRDVFKDPITDPGKRSKKGRISTWKDDNNNHIAETIEVAKQKGYKPVLEVVWKNGVMLSKQTFEIIRARANQRA